MCLLINLEKIYEVFTFFVIIIRNTFNTRKIIIAIIRIIINIIVVRCIRKIIITFM